MFQIIRSDQRHFADHGWLQTRWHFSFGDYYDPANLGFGPLRVFNDDVVQGGGGFGMHGHRDMEIISYGIEGALAHQDDHGHSGLVRPGEVQVMSAGRGIRHAEHNASATEAAHFLQIWIEPRTRSLPPRYEHKPFDGAARQGKLLPVVSDGALPGTLTIDQDATVYVSSLKQGQTVAHDGASGRRQYLFVIAGALDVNGHRLAAGDQARITGEAGLSIRATEDAELMLIDLP